MKRTCYRQSDRAINDVKILNLGKNYSMLTQKGSLHQSVPYENYHQNNGSWWLFTFFMTKEVSASSSWVRRKPVFAYAKRKDRSAAR